MEPDSRFSIPIIFVLANLISLNEFTNLLATKISGPGPGLGTWDSGGGKVNILNVNYYEKTVCHCTNSFCFGLQF